MTNAEAVQKVTSVLRVPQIVRKASNSPFLHHLPKESDAYIVQVSIKISIIDNSEISKIF